MKRIMSAGSKNVLTLLPPLSFIISFFLFFLASPPLAAIPGDHTSSMTGNGGFSYQPNHNNQNVSVYSQSGLIVASGYYLSFLFQRNVFESIPVYLKSVSISSGIRAPPFNALSAQ